MVVLTLQTRIPKGPGMLIVIGGLPGTGKTTIARLLAQKRPVAYLRIDAIEHAIIQSQGQRDLGPTGYMVAYELAKSNLALGISVIADCVNPLEITRQAWRDVAQIVGSPWMDVEVVCSNLEEHERRVNSRKTDLEGFRLPTWGEVMSREYEPWRSSRLQIDTSSTTAEEAAASILRRWSTRSP